MGRDLLGHRGEEALALGVCDLLAGEAVVAAGQGTELAGLLALIAASLRHRGQVIRAEAGIRADQSAACDAGQASAGWGAPARAMRLASAWPR